MTCHIIALCQTNKDDLLVETGRSESVYSGFVSQYQIVLYKYRTHIQHLRYSSGHHDHSYHSLLLNKSVVVVLTMFS